MSLNDKLPPNYREAQCCGTCVQWEWGYEGEGKCNKYPEYKAPDFTTIYDSYSWKVCDEWAGSAYQLAKQDKS
jgi:hypothetical protein